MKVHGDFDLLTNQLLNFVLHTDTDFPANPKPGTFSFRNKKLYFCVEIASGLPVWIPLTQEIDAYIHVQDTPSTAWTIPHNLGTSNAFVQIVDVNGVHLIPDYVSTQNFNTASATFSSPQTGRAIVMLGSLSGAAKDVVAYSQSFTGATSVVVAHGLGYLPEVSVFVGNKLVQPQSIVHDSVSQATITFSAAQTGIVRCV